MKTDSAGRLGTRQRRMLDFAARYAGPHSLTSNHSDPAHRALAALSRRGLLVRLEIGCTVMFELPARTEGGAL